MLNNYLKFIVRHFFRNKLTNLISILGLAIGFGCVLLASFYILWEINFDSQFSDTDNTYRIMRSTIEENGQKSSSHRTSGALAGVIEAEYPEVIQTTRLMIRNVYAKVDKKNQLARMCVVDDNFFQMFDFSFFKGDPNAIGKEPSGLVLSEAFALTLFGSEDPIGRTIETEGTGLSGIYRVVGVLKGPGNHTTIRFDILTTESSAAEIGLRGWSVWRPRGWRFVETYVKLREDSDPTEFEKKIQKIIINNMGSEIAKRNSYRLQSFRSIYLYSLNDFGIAKPYARDNFEYGDVNRLYGTAIIAGLVLLIGTTNYINLSIAHSSLRAKEIGIRKAVGAHRVNLAVQLILEAICTSFIALIVGCFLTWVIFFEFQFQDIAGIAIEPEMLLTPIFIVFVLLGTLVSGFLSGLYPSLYLSSLEPVKAIKSETLSSAKGTGLRRILVTFQYIVSAALITFTLIVSYQLEFLRKTDLGFNHSQIISLPLFEVASQSKHWGWFADDLKRQYQNVKHRFLDIPAVVNATVARGLLISFFDGSFKPIGTKESLERNINYVGVDNDFLETFDIPLKSGRNFGEQLVQQWEEGNELDLIVTEAAVKEFGWAEPIGQRLEWPYYKKVGVVIGVVEDFHLGSLRNETPSVILIPEYRDLKYIHLRVQTSNLFETLNDIEQVWKAYLPDWSFEYKFLDEEIDALYQAENQLYKMLRTFSILAILVAMFGIFGLASFISSVRTREVAIRKVLGATTTELIRLLLHEHVVIVLISSLIATPSIYYIGEAWLQTYAHRIDIDLFPFAVSCLSCLFVTVFATSFHILKAIKVNPSELLKDE